MLLFPDPGAKRIYEIFAVTYWNVQIFGKTHTRHDAHKHCPFPYLAVMLCTVLGCLCSPRIYLSKPSLPKLYTKNFFPPGDSTWQICTLRQLWHEIQFIISINLLLAFQVWQLEYTCCNFNFKSITRNNHVGSLGLHFLSNCCLCFHTNGNLGGDFPLELPPLPRSRRPSQGKCGPLVNP